MIYRYCGFYKQPCEYKQCDLAPCRGQERRIKQMSNFKLFFYENGELKMEEHETENEALKAFVIKDYLGLHVDEIWLDSNGEERLSNAAIHALLDGEK